MDAIFAYILKVNVLLILFYLVYQLALSRETFYKHSRWFLLSGLFVSLVLPFVTFTKIEYYEVKRVLNNSIENNVPQMVQISNDVAQEPILSNQEILFLVYGIICFGFLIKTMFDFIKLFKIIKVSNSEKKDKLIYINTNLVHTPFSFFNYIVFNSELINPVELQNIIKHEEAHSKQKHSFDTLLAQFFIILFWFNPIVWLYRKSIVQNLEFLADSFAITQVSDKEYYQKTMLKITTQSSNISIINTFNQSSIKKRIIMLNTNQSNRKNIWKFGIILPFVSAFMLLFQVETIAQEKESKTIKQEIKADTIVWKENFESIYNSPYESDTKESLKRVFVINGKVYTKEDLKNKNIAQFKDNATISKLKSKEAINLYGQKAKDGAVIFKGDWKIIDNLINNGDVDLKEERYIIDDGDWKKVDSILKSSTEFANKKISVKKNITNNEVKLDKKIEKSKSLEIDAVIKEKEVNFSNSESDTFPEPQNGMQEFRKNIAKNFRLPEVKSDVNATIVAKFIVLKTGEISGITIVTENPKNLGLNDEMIRILKESPKWKPGTKDGKPADLYFVLPVSVQIQATK